MIRLSRAELNDVVSYSIRPQAALEEQYLRARTRSFRISAIQPGAQSRLLDVPSELAAWPKCKFHHVRDSVVTGDIEVQFERALVLHHGHLLIEHLHVRHLPVREVELTPKTAILGRRERVVAVS